MFGSEKKKKLIHELSETKKLLERERQRAEAESKEREDLEIELWKMESEIRKYQYRENRVRDVLKYEYWKRISPLYTMYEEDLKRIVSLEPLFSDRESEKWGVVECYCAQCGNALQARYFKRELEALRYLAVKQALGIAPGFDTCLECYQNRAETCA